MSVSAAPQTPNQALHLTGAAKPAPAGELCRSAAEGATVTMALCFNCGHTKFGAICHCPECGVASSGDMNLDITFSDHQMSVATLGAFGEVVRAIQRVCDDDQLRFWSFIRYVSVHHSDILGVQQPPEQQVACDAVLARAQPPPVSVEESPMSRFSRPPDSAEGTGGPPAKRPWWRFWR